MEDILNSIKIETTRGPKIITEEDKILIHEHVFNRYPYWQQYRMEKFVIEELCKLYKAGISVIVDLTAYTQVYNYYTVIDQSPVVIVSCIGFYTMRYVPAELKKKSYESLIKLYGKKIERGIGTRYIKPGIIKIAAQDSTLNENEKKFFRVVAFLSNEYGLPIAIHAPKGTLAHVEQLIEYGASPQKILAAHIENGTNTEKEYYSRLSDAKKIMDLGVYIQLADFGCTRTSQKCKRNIQFATSLIEDGYINKLLLSGDSCWRWKNNNFVVKESNKGVGKPYTYTVDFSLPLLEERFPSYNLRKVLLNKNPVSLFSREESL